MLFSLLSRLNADALEVLRTISNFYPSKQPPIRKRRSLMLLREFSEGSAMKMFKNEHRFRVQSASQTLKHVWTAGDLVE